MQDLRQNFIASHQAFREGAVSLFRQVFETNLPRKATLTMTALGLYEAEINGETVGEQLFAPGFTYYHRHLLFQVHDVTRHLRPGLNDLKVYLGQGWYCGRFTYHNKVQIYGDRPAVSWILDLEQVDGKRTRIASDPAVVELESPYDYAGFYDGEVYHSGRDQRVIAQAVPYRGKVPEILEETMIQVRVQETISARSTTVNGDTTILDFGQNFAGFLEIDPRRMQASTLRIRHGEILNPDGSLYTRNLRKAKAEIVYTKGTSTRIYRPRFTYMGFRYAELSGTPYVEGLLTARAIYSHMPRTGYFWCEHPLVTKLFENQVWGQKSNYVEVPTDCPQRDERMGYTGDGHVFALTGAFNFDTLRFWKKFLKDIRFSQLDNTEGYIRSVAPADGPEGIGRRNMLGWGNAVTIIPEMLYWQYGTEEPQADQYDSMKRFVEAEIRHLGSDGLWVGRSLGDWLMPGKSMRWMERHNNPVSNAFIIHDLDLMAHTAKRLGQDDDASRYEQQASISRIAYIRRFIKKNGVMKDRYQGAAVLALRYVLPSGELYNRVLRRLVKDLRRSGMQTGFFSTEHLLPLLAEAGEITLAYDLLLQETCPGWMYQILRGATTTWERWDALRLDGSVNETKNGSDNMVSFNHYAFGSVGEFYYQYILGIKPLRPGYQRISIHPRVDRRLGKVEGSYLSRAGEIRVAWQVVDGSVVIQILTPVPTLMVTPDGERRWVEAGAYHFESSFPNLSQ